MFENMLAEMNRGKQFYELVGTIGMYKKDDFYTITRGKNGELPFRHVKMGGVEYPISHVKMTETLASQLQEFIWKNYSALLLKEARDKTAWLSDYLNAKLIGEARLLIDDAEVLSQNDGSIKIVEILDLIVRIDDYMDNFYEFFNKIAAGSSTPAADFLNPIVEVLKLGMAELKWDLSDFFDLFWEYRESVKDGSIYTLTFQLNDVEKSFRIDTVLDLIGVYESNFANGENK